MKHADILGRNLPQRIHPASQDGTETKQSDEQKLEDDIAAAYAGLPRSTQWGGKIPNGTSEYGGSYQFDAKRPVGCDNTGQRRQSEQSDEQRLEDAVAAAFAGLSRSGRWGEEAQSGTSNHGRGRHFDGERPAAFGKMVRRRESGQSDEQRFEDDIAAAYADFPRSVSRGEEAWSGTSEYGEGLNNDQQPVEERDPKATEQTQ